MKHKLTAAMVLAGLVAVPMFGQSMGGKPPSKESEEIRGSGKPGHLTKFTGNRTVGDSELIESGGSLTTSESLNVGPVSASVPSAPGVAVHATSTTTAGSLDWDAFYSSGIIGILSETSSPASVAVQGMAYSTTGHPVGVFGKTYTTDGGIGVRGQGSGAGIGVLGEASSETGFGIIGVNGASGHPVAVHGYIVSPDGGTAMLGRAAATTGDGIGVKGEAFSSAGVGGSFENNAGGNIMYGIGVGGIKLRVDGNGTVFANGGFQPYGADFAESMEVSGDPAKYAAGDVLVY